MSGAFDLARDAQSRVLHLVRDSWRRQLWDSFLRTVRRDSAVCQGVGFDPKLIAATCRVFRGASVEEAGVMVGAAHSLAAYHVIAHDAPPRAFCDFCKGNVVPSWGRLGGSVLSLPVPGQGLLSTPVSCDLDGLLLRTRSTIATFWCILLRFGAGPALLGVLGF